MVMHIKGTQFTRIQRCHYLLRIIMWSKIAFII